MNNDSINLKVGQCAATTYSVPVGPVHPALKEPIRFSFDLDGERIVGVDIKPGFAHRGIEYMGMKRNLVQTLYLSERICGICSVSHPLAFAQAVENAAGIEVPPRAQYIRTIIGELERVHSHLLWAGVGAHELGFDTLLHLTWNVREKCMTYWKNSRETGSTTPFLCLAVCVETFPQRRLILPTKPLTTTRDYFSR